ncbi:MAG: hypothetical protein IPL54_04360 [Chitinophagaceae bacterium]|nr:hypothetical protein [Chitinophagaceae bacterium]
MVVKKNLKFYLIVFFLPILSISCNNNQHDGGGCKYDTKIFPATVIGLVDTANLSYDVLFEVNASGILDTVRYSDKNNHHRIFIADIPTDSLVPGSQYQYVIRKRLTGTCSPVVDFIVLEPYQAL